MAKIKLKTHRRAYKLFGVTGRGKLTRTCNFRGHFMEGKTAKRKRGLRQGRLVSKADEKRVRRLLPYV